MRIGSMLGDVLQSLFQKPATQLYPYVHEAAPATFRGKLIWEPAKCTGCQLCVKDCPAAAIELITIDKATKRFVMRYDIDRCTYCAQCVVSCRQKCLSMSADQWELAALSREPFRVYYGREEDVKTIEEKEGAQG